MNLSYFCKCVYRADDCRGDSYPKMYVNFMNDVGQAF